MESSKKSPVLDTLEALVVAVVLALAIRLFLFEPFMIPSASMEPTLVPGDRVMVNKLVYRLGDPEPGDVIVFRYPPDPHIVYIKRVVAVGGQSVELRNGQLFVDGQKVQEEYLPQNPGGGGDFGPVKVPAGTYFVMGDNRNNSQDSRVWGPVPRQNLLGKAQLLYWPPDRFRVVR
ncbi:MAG: signal peptidase I [Clostridia bacterium]|jgi:signal peptidase I|nr:signal peptidase I [Clostridia bacterium]MDH7572413.1 signal peptidase I [Clostridia bacterium]